MSELIHYYSNWYKLLKAVAWLSRFKRLLHGKLSTTDPKTCVAEGGLSVTEIDNAVLDVSRHVQQESITSGIDHLRWR